ncbi:MAG: CoA-binding protein [bacterium]
MDSIDVLNNLREPPERFISKDNKFVIFSVTPKDGDEGYYAYTTMQKNGYTVMAVGAKAQKLEKITIYTKLVDLPDMADVAYIATSSEKTKAFIEDCIKANIQKIWFRPSTENSELLDFCRKNSIDVMSYRDLARGLANSRAYC